MYTYVKRNIPRHYVTLENKLNPDLYSNIGSTYQDYLYNKYVLLTDEQVAFHNEYPEATVEEVFNLAINDNSEPARTIEVAKTEMLQKIDSHDASDEVNGFLINGIKAWFTVQERNNYKASIDSAKLLGIESLSFFIGDHLLTITPEMAEHMLAAIQLYADQCFIVTKQHKLKVESLESIEEVDLYDYYAGYPKMLEFEL